MSKPKAADAFWDNFKQIFFAVIMAVIIKASIVEAYKIPSESMEDTLLVGDFLLANKFVYGARLPVVDWRLPAFSKPERGDVVIFIYPVDKVTKYIKRCVAIGGDTVEVKDKILYLNGEAQELPEYGKFIKSYSAPRRAGGADSPDNWGPYVVPKDHYFMMGDNRDNSQDSRWFLAVPYELVLGEAMMIHWSWSDDNYPSPDVSIDDPLSVPRMFIYNAVHFFQKVRWNRLFNIIS